MWGGEGGGGGGGSHGNVNLFFTSTPSFGKYKLQDELKFPRATCQKGILAGWKNPRQPLFFLLVHE